MSNPSRARLVGPVFDAGPVASAIAAAIAETNDDVTVVDRGAYLRVAAPGRCSVTRAEIERRIGVPFVLPGDLEKIMPAFAGHITITEDDVVWEAGAFGRRS